MIRIYQAIPLVKNTTICLDEKASHHVARVLRAQVGETVVLFNGEGGEYRAVINGIHKKDVEVRIIEFVAREAESALEIHLAQGIARGEKMDFIVQKAVELGVRSITPLLTERCNVKLDGGREAKRALHWQAVAISACEQSGRNRLPQINAAVALDAWLATVKAEQCFVLSPHVEAKLTTPAKLNSAALLIGPEGGLSENEEAAAIKHGFLPLNLGPRILRTETATLAAVAVLQGRFGDLG
jgi:16S rRNA (uracil1498-N3)-methyltransferase